MSEQPMAETKTKREQVKDLIIEGVHTKAEIAAALEMSPASVSSQMTYLRWMGNHIIYDENKILSTCTKEEFETWETTRAANKKTKTASKKTPDQLAAASAKTLVTLKNSLTKWEKRIKDTTKDSVDDFDEFVEESSAHVTILGIEIQRAIVRAQYYADAADTTAKVAEAEAEIDAEAEAEAADTEDSEEYDDSKELDNYEGVNEDDDDLI